MRVATAAEPVAVAGAAQVTNSVGMKLVLISSGTFLMGSGESAEDAAAAFNKIYGGDLLKPGFFKDEYPQHRVRITRPFYLGACHVTRGQFRKFVEDAEYTTDAEKGGKPGALGWNPETEKLGFNENFSWRSSGFEQTDVHPAIDVSWNDAVAFCKWLSRKEGRTYRLPTEAEWEYACRAGTTTRYFSGDDPETLAEFGNVADASFKARFPGSKYTLRAKDGFVFTAPVASFKPNGFGLYDMHGNAWQWCSDRYDPKCYTPAAKDDPAGPTSGDLRLLRGGSWVDGPVYTRSAKRSALTPGSRSDFTGFRVARTL